MRRPVPAADAATRPPVLISGWMTDSLAAGVKPAIGYPASRLPEVTKESMNFTTGFLARRPKP